MPISNKPKPRSKKSFTRSAEPKYKLKPEIASREIEGQILVLTPREEFLYTLNDSGKVLWSALQRGATEKQLVKALVAAYAVPAAQAQQDVRIFLRELKTKGILAAR